MIKDVLLYANPKFHHRITLSSGTRIIQSLNGLPAAEDTFIPKEPWRKPSNEERDLIFGNEADGIPYQSIGLIEMPESLVQDWKSLQIHHAKSESDIQRVMNQPSYAGVVKQTADWVKTYQGHDEELITHRLACISKDLTTVTFNSKEQRYLGLHLDSWEKQPLQELAKVRNRICINLGRDTRYFLYVNIQIEKFKELTNQPRESRPRKLIHDFLKQNPDYPVIRVALNPFEAYIAPTENLIHDGSSLGQEFQDVQLTFRSFFQVKSPVATKKSIWKRIFAGS